MITLHSSCGRHFLGLRKGKAGQYEIVYDNEHRRKRLIWKVTSAEVSEEAIGNHLHQAIKTATVLDALLLGLRDAEIEFEVDYDGADNVAMGR